MNASLKNDHSHTFMLSQMYIIYVWRKQRFKKKNNNNNL